MHDLCCQLDIDAEIIVRLQVKETMDILNIHSQRKYVDKCKDRGNYWKALLELCKNHGVCIYIGRVGPDKEIGKETTTDGSVIDYVIGSPFVLNKTTDFVVHDFDGVFSDMHSLVTWQRQCQCNINNVNVQQNQTLDVKKANGRIIWRNDMRDEYTTYM